MKPSWNFCIDASILARNPLKAIKKQWPMRIRKRYWNLRNCSESIQSFWIFWLSILHILYRVFWQNIASPIFLSLYPSYPDSVPCNFSLFILKLKLPLTKRRFQSVDNIKENMMKQIMMILKEDFTDCFETLKGYWDKMKTLKWTKTNGVYFFCW